MPSTTNGNVTTASATNTSLSSQNHNNPWENAANDSAFFVHEYEEQLLVNTTGDESLLSSRRSNMSCGTKWLLLMHVADVLCGMGLVVYAYLRFQEEYHDLFMSICAYVLAGVWTSRGVLVVLFSSSNTSCALRCSGTLSLVLMILYSSVSALAAMDPLIIYHRVPDLPLGIRSYLWSLWLVVAAWECLRWALLSKRQDRHDEQEQEEQEDPTRADYSYSYDSHARRRPWWWKGMTTNANANANANHQFHSQRDSLDTPLIDEGGGPHSNNSRHRHPWASSNSRNFSMDHGIHNSPRQKSWWPFSSSRQEDDNASVDEYASINEDWASKSEEDPFWWTKEQGTSNHGNGNTGGPKDTSWTQEADRHVV
jgi:hypothetical protein